MTLLLKDPQAMLDYVVDWGAEYLGEDALAQSAWAVMPVESGGISVVDSSFDQRLARVSAAGGVRGHVYTLVNDVVLTSGLSDSRSIVVRVEKR